MVLKCLSRFPFSAGAQQGLHVKYKYFEFHMKRKEGINLFPFLMKMIGLPLPQISSIGWRSAQLFYQFTSVNQPVGGMRNADT